MAKPRWITEHEAARRLRRAPRTLRRLVKAGTLDISYTHINGRTFFYDELGIERVLLKNAHIIR